MKYSEYLIKPVSSSCNLNCNYCFYYDVSNRRDNFSYGKLSIETLEILVKKAFFETTEFITFGFQGGEPLLAGYDFYHSFFEFIDKYNINNIKYEITLQTNATLITKEFLELFKKHNVLLGISLDGTKKIHDKYRLDFADNGSFTKVIDSIKLVRSYNIDFNILTVVTKDLVPQVKNLYNYFRQMSFDYLQFSECIDRSPIQGDLESFSLDPHNHYIFLTKLFDLWYADLLGGKYVSIRNFDLIMQKILGNWHLIPCYAKGVCACQSIVEANGNFYTCDFYVNEDNNLGNIEKSSIESILQSDKIAEFIDESIPLHNDCKTCPVYNLCRNGCKRYRVEGKYYYCESTKKFLLQKRDKFLKAIELISIINSKK